MELRVRAPVAQNCADRGAWPLSAIRQDMLRVE